MQQQQQPPTTLHHDDQFHKKSLRRSPRQHQNQHHSSQFQLVLASFDDPQPLKVIHPRTTPTSNDKLLLLTCSTAQKSLRRSPRLSGLSNGVDSEKCRATLSMDLLNSSGKKVNCSKSKKLVSPDFVNGKRKLDGLESSAGISRKRLKTSNVEVSELVRRSPRFSCSKSEFIAEIGVESGKSSPMKLIKSVDSEKSDFEKLKSVRRSPRLSNSTSDSAAEIGVKLGKKSPLKLIKSAECEENGSSKFVRRSPRVSGSKSESKVEVAVKSREKSPLKLIKSVESEEGEFKNSKFVRRSPRVSGSKSEPTVEVAVKSGIKSPLKLIKSAESEENEFNNSKCVRRSSRFNGSKIEPRAEIGVNLVENSPLKLIKSLECKESEDQSEMKSACLVMGESLGSIEGEKVLRRSPRGLPSSLGVEDEFDEFELRVSSKKIKKKKKAPKEEAKVIKLKSNMRVKSKNCFFVGEAVSEEEALQRWGWRYQLKNRRINGRSLTGNAMDEDEPIVGVKCHYTQAQINGCIYHLGDCVLIRGEGRQKHIGRIMEFFQTAEQDYFRAQWFYKPEDTVMKEEATLQDKKRIFYSCIMNDNLLACIISKLNVLKVAPQLNSNSSSIESSDFYYDMEYCLDYSTFRNLPTDKSVESCILPSLSCLDSILSVTSSPVAENTSICETYNTELTMLDLYAGCGAMSTGLCIGARISGVNLVTRWAVDADRLACESLQSNHSNIQVKNETADNFLELLKHWDSLCKQFVLENSLNPFPSPQEVSDVAKSSDSLEHSDITADELEVSSLVDICYSDADGSGKQGLKFKVRWKGFGPCEDTWEPIEGLSHCQELIQEFVINGFKNKILPLPGDVDVICGGPPCQGISGYNRFRTVDAPLTDEKNRQLVVFMDIVEYLKPKFVLMENVMDILRFDKGSLGRYALSRLVHMKYQARVGIVAAGCYGLPQFRLRVFFWGALPSEQLPQFPLPTHDVVVRYWPPAEFERNVVAYDEGTQPPDLEDAVFLGDAISDLPAVTNYESLDEMAYSIPPETEFQQYIRSTKHEEAVLYDHRPHQLFEDDYIRVCQIPRRKGANFRDLPGIIVGDDNVVRRDPTQKTVLLSSGRPMVPDYAFTFEQGKSKRPFARLWWDETMPTIVTYPNCHSQAILHPEQDRVLTVRECARLQGFPDNYRFCGTVKKRYRQVGNAVAIPVAKALGYALGMASQKLTSEVPLLTLPPKFAYSNPL